MGDEQGLLSEPWGFCQEKRRHHPPGEPVPEPERPSDSRSLCRGRRGGILGGQPERSRRRGALRLLHEYRHLQPVRPEHAGNRGTAGKPRKSRAAAGLRRTAGKLAAPFHRRMRRPAPNGLAGPDTRAAGKRFRRRAGTGLFGYGSGIFAHTPPAASDAGEVCGRVLQMADWNREYLKEIPLHRAVRRREHVPELHEMLR